MRQKENLVRTRKLLLAATLIGTLTLSGCNLWARATPTLDVVQIAQTSAAQTVAAGLTQVGPTVTPAASATASPTLIPTPSVSATAVTSSTAAPCDKAGFVSETIPDDSVFAPNAAFTKTWRLRNTGTCAWTSSYALVFDNGDQMGAPNATNLAGTVNPGQTVDLAVNLTSPSSPGSYRGNFKLRNGAGVIFGLEPSGTAPFWVQIMVGPVAYSFYDRAPSAEWITCGDPCGGGTAITFGGPDTDPNGFAMYRDGTELENGNSPARTFESHPMWVDNGVISGLFSSYTVQSGDHFKARIGFRAKEDGTCGTGDATYQVNYKEAGSLHPLGSFPETCDGSVTPVDIDLSSLAGHTVQFALVVLANGSSEQDWAVWVDPRIER
jgi:hypothetical protein